MSHRAERLAAAIERAVREVLARGLADERIRGLVTVTGVRLSGDHKEATITVSVLPEQHESLTLHGLNSAAPHIRRQVGEKFDVREVPQLRFSLDRTLKKEAAVLRDIDRAAADLEARAKNAQPEESGG